MLFVCSLRTAPLGHGIRARGSDHLKPPQAFPVFARECLPCGQERGASRTHRIPTHLHQQRNGPFIVLPDNRIKTPDSETNADRSLRHPQRSTLERARASHPPFDPLNQQRWQPLQQAVRLGAQSLRAVSPDTLRRHACGERPSRLLRAASLRARKVCVSKNLLERG